MFAESKANLKEFKKMKIISKMENMLPSFLQKWSNYKRLLSYSKESFKKNDTPMCHHPS